MYPPDYNCWYQYVIVRKDMPRHYHIIQACHAVQEATLMFGGPCEFNGPKVDMPIHLILLEVPNEQKLIEAYAKTNGIRGKVFYEPDYQSGFTAVAFELLKRDDPRREYFRQFRMYK